jgi:hypothetical protein
MNLCLTEYQSIAFHLAWLLKNILDDYLVSQIESDLIRTPFFKYYIFNY